MAYVKIDGRHFTYSRLSRNADDVTISQEKLESTFPRLGKVGKENEVVFCRKVTFLKTKLHLGFPLFSLLEPPI